MFQKEFVSIILWCVPWIALYLRGTEASLDRSVEEIDPCHCKQHVVISIVNSNNTLRQGDLIAIFSSSVNVTLTAPCSNFSITGGNLTLNGNASCLDQLSCTLECHEETCPTTTASLLVNIINDFAPKFPNSSYQINVSENATLNTTLLNFSETGLKPFNPYCPAVAVNCNYNLLAGNQQRDFKMVSGKLQVVRILDFETTKVYTLTVAATLQVNNAKETGFTTVIVTIIDSDDLDPRFEHARYNIGIPEETLSNSWVTAMPTIFAYDQDFGINATILYSFKDFQNNTDFLEINPTNGQLRSTTKLDRETRSSFTFLLMCYQGNNKQKKATAILLVTVSDINDNPAVFFPVQYQVGMNENSVGYVVTVTATDKDVDENAVIRYEIMFDDLDFVVDSVSGVISVNASNKLDREQSKNRTIRIIAKDSQGNSSQNTATVVVTLLDVNDNNPVFDSEHYVFKWNTSIVEDGTPLGKVVATDKDEKDTPNSNVTYHVTSLWAANNVEQTTTATLQIHEITGVISNNEPLVSPFQYIMLISACDNPVDLLSKRCTLVRTYILSDISMHQPMVVRENVPPGTIVDKLILTGNKYECSTEYFNVDPKSGMLCTMKTIDREEHPDGFVYQFSVTVLSYTGEAIGNISVSVSILDANDNQPYFLQDEYFFTFPSSETSIAIGKIIATDRDTGENSNVSYSFQKQTKELFAIDKKSGDITVTNLWKGETYYHISLFRLITIANDNGVPCLNSSVPVYVSALMIKDNRSVSVPLRLSNALIMSGDTKKLLERDIAALMHFPTISIIGVEELGVRRSNVLLKATDKNGLEVPIHILQSAVVASWNSLQNLFRQYESFPDVSRSGGMSAAEIGLIAMAAILLVGTSVCIAVVRKQWERYVKNNQLYEHLRRPSALYESQELQANFGNEDYSNHSSTFQNQKEIPVEGSFGLGCANATFFNGEDNAPKTPIWSTNSTPRIPRWSNSDSLKYAIASLEDLTNRLNAEDSISRVTNMSRERRSLRSFKTEHEEFEENTNNAGDNNINIEGAKCNITFMSEYPRNDFKAPCENVIVNDAELIAVDQNMDQRKGITYFDDETAIIEESTAF